MIEHNIVIKARKLIEISGVTGVVGFDSESIVLDTAEGRVTVEGRALTVNDLSVSDGKISASGEVISVQYTKVQSDSGKGFFARIFK